MKATSTENMDPRWRNIQIFLQEVGIVVDYLHWRAVRQCHGDGEKSESPLFALQASLDGPLTEAAIVEQLEAIARQARKGFVAGPDFPVFGALKEEASRREWARIKSTLPLWAILIGVTASILILVTSNENRLRRLKAWCAPISCSAWSGMEDARRGVVYESTELVRS